MMFRRKTGRGLVAGGIPRVNLLPPRELENRARTEHWRRWRLAFIWAFVVVALAWMVALPWNLLAHADLDATVRHSQELQSQLVGYSEVIDRQSEVQKLKAVRALAGSNDQDWRALNGEIKAVLPPGVTLVGFKLAPGAAPLPGIAPSAQLGLSGTLTFSAAGTSAQAQTIAQLRTIHGFIDVDAGALASSGPAGGFTFVATFSADQTRYSGRYLVVGGK